MRALKNLLFVICVPLIALALIWPHANESWQIVHLAYFFYYFIVPVFVCWIAFLYLEHLKVKSSKISSVANASVAATILFLISVYTVDWVLPGTSIEWENMALQIVYIGVLFLFVTRSIFIVQAKTD